jgi:hypothetical protein
MQKQLTFPFVVPRFNRDETPEAAFRKPRETSADEPPASAIPRRFRLPAGMDCDSGRGDASRRNVHCRRWKMALDHPGL